MIGIQTITGIQVITSTQTIAGILQHPVEHSHDELECFLLLRIEPSG